MPDFIYDKMIRDHDSHIRIDVTVVDVHSDVMLTIKSGAISIPVFINAPNAMLLAAALTNAVCAYDDAIAAREAETHSE